MFHDCCQSVTLVFCQRTHVSHDHHPTGPCCSRARISYDEPCMGAISYQKIFASALITVAPPAGANRIDLLVSSPQLSSSGTGNVTLTALLRDAANNVLSGVPVRF